jgi:hypothetical protein
LTLPVSIASRLSLPSSLSSHISTISSANFLACLKLDVAAAADLYEQLCGMVGKLISACTPFMQFVGSGRLLVAVVTLALSPILKNYSSVHEIQLTFTGLLLRPWHSLGIMRPLS